MGRKVIREYEEDGIYYQLRGEWWEENGQQIRVCVPWLRYIRTRWYIRFGRRGSTYILLFFFLIGSFYYRHPGCMPRPWRIDISDPETPSDHRPDLDAMVTVPTGMVDFGCPKEWDEKLARDPDYNPSQDRPWIDQIHQTIAKVLDSERDPWLYWQCRNKYTILSEGRQEQLVLAFKIDKYEVTVKEYLECVKHGACTDPSTHSDTLNRDCTFGRPSKQYHPMNCLSAKMAEQYCAWEGKRLPSVDQWLRAYQGDDARIFPWGNDFSKRWTGNVCGYRCMRANMMDHFDGYHYFDGFFRVGVSTRESRPETWARTAPVGVHPDAASQFGVHDMHGNVAEFVMADSKLNPVTYARMAIRAEKGKLRPSREYFELGSRFTSAHGFRYETHPRSVSPNPDRMSGSYMGFRCASPLAY